MYILHVITGLNEGGAEGVLFRLCTCDKVNMHIVISLSSLGTYGPLLLSRGFKVYALGMLPSWPSPYAFIRLIRLIRSHRPDVVQTWMYHADLFGALAARASGLKAIVWGVRNSTLEKGKSKYRTVWIMSLLAKLSSWLPSKIVVCSRNAMDVHEKLGYDRRKMCFVANGYDLSDFKPRKTEGASLRRVLDMPLDIPLIGMVSRYDRQKDHASLFQALALLKPRNVTVRCIFVGSNVDENNAEIMDMVRRLSLQDTVKLLGRRNDIPTIMSAIDLHVLPSSYGEAFPNVVAEAMACETPCVVTNVGDAAEIVGDTGWVIPPQNADVLADAIQEALEQLHTPQWGYRRIAARSRISQKFSIERMVRNYQRVWKEAMLECAA
jgi:glycosyltransferase involved in cell wall biosynthesis